MKIGLLSLGCPKNLVDSEVMLGLARESGHDLTPDPADAEVLVVNTCAFIDKAKQESIEAILEMAAHKQSGKCQRLIVTGCLAERYRDELRLEIPEIDVVLGTGEVPDIVRAIESDGTPRESRDSRAGTGSDRATTSAARGEQKPVGIYRRDGEQVGARVSARHRTPVASRPLPTYLYDATTPRVMATPRHYAYVKVAEGCDYNCAFCIIPTLRGQYRSRSTDSIVQEARQLASQGVREVLLISQDTTFYGIDRRERGALAHLLTRLNEVAGLEWIRLLYLYPTTITDDVLSAMADLPKVCRYVDLPLQHSAHSMLKRMRRPGARADYERLLDRIRQRVPGVTLRTTVIVGFPGETASEFDDLCEFVRAVGFDHLGVFTYSHEEGTSAFQFADNVPRRVKAERKNILMGLQQEIVTRRNQDWVGTRTKVMIDGPSAEHPLVIQGRLEGSAPDIDTVVYLTDADPAQAVAGTVIETEIVGAHDYDLLARPLSPLFVV